MPEEKQEIFFRKIFHSLMEKRVIIVMVMRDNALEETENEKQSFLSKERLTGALITS